MTTSPERTSSFSIRGPIARADLPALCNRICVLLEREAAPALRCDVHGVGVDAVTVDALARLQLAARRRGCCIELVNASSELVELIAFMGLTDVFHDDY